MQTNKFNESLVHRNCLIAAVGVSSLHREWIEGCCDFDIYLLVYDNSAQKWNNDNVNIISMKGYKLKMVYDYLNMNPELYAKYDYFLLADDDIRMSSCDINHIFSAMKKYDLKIGQPTLACSYYSWPHTLHHPMCKIRYTNFIEMMIPCFASDVLKNILFTFNENATGWGCETHWPILINSNHKDMAVIDEVKVIHTRKIQSWKKIQFEDQMSYSHKYGIITEIKEYGFIPSSSHLNKLFAKDKYDYLSRALTIWINEGVLRPRTMGMDGLCGYILLLINMAKITNARNYLDNANVLLSKGLNMGCLKHDMTLRSGLIGCCSMLEELLKDRIIENSPIEFFNEADSYIVEYVKNNNALSLEELASVGYYLLKKKKNYHVSSYDNLVHTFAKQIIQQLEKQTSISSIYELIALQFFADQYQIIFQSNCFQVLSTLAYDMTYSCDTIETCYLKFIQADYDHSNLKGMITFELFPSASQINITRALMISEMML